MQDVKRSTTFAIALVVAIGSYALIRLVLFLVAPAGELTTGTTAGFPGVPAMPTTSDNSIQLTEVTEAWGVRFRHFGGRRGNFIPEDMGSGIAAGDYDRDGDPDLFVPAINSLRSFLRPDPRLVSHALLRNDRGHLTDVTEQTGLTFSGIGMGAVFADLDGDGWLDLVVTQFGPLLIFRNLGDGRFSRVAASGIEERQFAAGASLGDIDGDGDLDLYVPHYVEFNLKIPPAPPADENVPAPLPPRVQRLLTKEDDLYVSPPPYGILPVNFRPQTNRLYRNDGEFRFTDITDAAGVSDGTGRSLQSLLADLDLDGDLDLFVANDVSNNRLYLNRGDGSFVDASSDSGLLDPRGSMGATLGELNGDGRPDLVVSNYSTDGLAIYLSDPPVNGIPRFRRAEELARVTQATLGRVGWSVGLVDLDLDGHQDLYVVQGHIRNLRDDPTRLGPQRDSLFRSLGGPVFEHLGGRRGGAVLEQAHVGRGGVFTDLDGDGDVDVITCAHGEGLRILRNDSLRSGGSLTLALVGRPPNTYAIGTRIRVRTGPLTQERIWLAGDGYLGDSGHEKIVALPENRPAEWIEVTWPGGRSPIRHAGPFPAGRTVLRQP